MSGEPFISGDRRARFERLVELLNDREPYDGKVPESLAEVVNDCCDEAGVGTISAPEAWFHDVYALGTLDAVVTFRHEHGEGVTVLVTRQLIDQGWSSRPPYEWSLWLRET